MAKEPEVNIPVMNPESIDREARFERQMALDYAIRVESMVTKMQSDDPLTVQSRVFKNAERILNYINTGELE